MEFRILINILLRRKYLFIIVLATTIIVAIIGSSIITPVYEAISRVKVESKDDTALLITQFPQRYSEYDSIVPTAVVTQSEVVMSGVVMEKVIDKLGLKERQTIINKIFSLLLRKKFKPQRLRADDFADPGIFTAFLQRRQVYVEPISDTDIIEIYAYDSDLKEAALIANTVAEVYLEVAAKEKRIAAKESLKALRRHYQDAKKELMLAENNLREFQEQSGIISLEEQLKEIVNEVGDYDRQISDINRQLEVTKDVIELAIKGLATDQKYTIFSSIEKQNPNIVTIRNNIDAARSQLKVLLTEFKENHPNVINVKAQLSEYENQLKEEAIKTFNSEKGRLTVEKNTLLQKMSELKMEIEGWPHRENEYNRRVRQVSLTETTYKGLQAQITTAEIAAVTDISTAILVQLAVLPAPEDPYYPEIIMYTIISIFVGVVLGFGIVMLVEYTDESIKSTEEAENNLKLPILGIIPKASRKDLEVSNFYKIGSLSSKMFDFTYRLFEQLKEGEKKVLITSSMIGDGKSTVSSHIGYITSQVNLKKTVIVDMNFVNSSIARMFDVAHKPGIAEYFSGTKAVEEIVHATKYDNLHVVPPGKLDITSYTGFYNKISSLVSHFEKNFDVVIFDAQDVPSIQARRHFINNIKTTIMTIKLRSTARSKAIRTKRLLESDGANILGLAIVSETKGLLN